jgi:hypothetical protein
LQVIGVTRRLGTVVPHEGGSVKTPAFDEEMTLLVQYHKDFGMPWPFLVGEDDKTNVSYGEMGVPMTVIIDKKGVIRRIQQGYKPGDDTSFVADLLKEP